MHRAPGIVPDDYNQSVVNKIGLVGVRALGLRAEQLGLSTEPMHLLE